MSKSASDILFSIIGASVAGVTVFFIDRHLAKKQSATAPIPTPDTIGVDNSFTQEFQAQVAQLGQGSSQPFVPAQSSTSSQSSSNCDGGCGGASTSQPISAPSLSQESILNSMNELSSLEANAGNIHYNRPITNLGH